MSLPERNWGAEFDLTKRQAAQLGVISAHARDVVANKYDGAVFPIFSTDRQAALNNRHAVLELLGSEILGADILTPLEASTVEDSYEIPETTKEMAAIAGPDVVDAYLRLVGVEVDEFRFMVGEAEFETTIETPDTARYDVTMFMIGLEAVKRPEAQKPFRPQNSTSSRAFEKIVALELERGQQFSKRFVVL
jgi:hypothetical protein